MVRDNILLHRHIIPKKVALPDGRNFYAKYEKVSRRNLPTNIAVRRKRTIRPRSQRRLTGSGILKYSSKFLNPAIGQNIAEEGIKNVSNIYSAGVNRISN